MIASHLWAATCRFNPFPPEKILAGAGRALDTKRDWTVLVRVALGWSGCNVELLLKQGEFVLMNFKQTCGPPAAASNYRWW
jgi:hypothetical protein